MDVSQEIHALENSPLANAKGAGCGLFTLRKGRGEGEDAPGSLENCAVSPTSGLAKSLGPPEVTTLNPAPSPDAASLGPG